MKTTLESQETSFAPRERFITAGTASPTWEYCFVLQDEWESTGGELTQLASAGWCVVSFRRRLDNQREYLLKRQRR
jgi:hypothetical protein